MTQRQWLSKSAVARVEGINRRTVQRTGRIWEELPGRKDYQVTDENGRVNLGGFRRFRASIKQLERRGFPPDGKRMMTRPWRQFLRRLKDQKAFGKTNE